MKGRKGRFLFTLFLTLLVFGFGTRIVRADETDNFQSDKKSIETAETKILEEEWGRGEGHSAPFCCGFV